jgi:hypothetical protein
MSAGPRPTRDRCDLQPEDALDGLPGRQAESDRRGQQDEEDHGEPQARAPVSAVTLEPGSTLGALEPVRALDREGIERWILPGRPPSRLRHARQCSTDGRRKE